MHMVVWIGGYFPLSIGTLYIHVHEYSESGEKEYVGRDNQRQKVISPGRRIGVKDIAVEKHFLQEEMTIDGRIR